MDVLRMRAVLTGTGARCVTCLPLSQDKPKSEFIDNSGFESAYLRRVRRTPCSAACVAAASPADVTAPPAGRAASATTACTVITVCGRHI
jgi:hypothetical protein